MKVVIGLFIFSFGLGFFYDPNDVVKIVCCTKDSSGQCTCYDTQYNKCGRCKPPPISSGPKPNS